MLSDGAHSAQSFHRQAAGAARVIFRCSAYVHFMSMKGFGESC